VTNDPGAYGLLFCAGTIAGVEGPPPDIPIGISLFEPSLLKEMKDINIINENEMI